MLSPAEQLGVVFSKISTSYALSAPKIYFGNTGNQNHPCLEVSVRVFLVSCYAIIDYFEAGNQPRMQKTVNKTKLDKCNRCILMWFC